MALEGAIAPLICITGTSEHKALESTRKEFNAVKESCDGHILVHNFDISKGNTLIKGVIM